MAEFTHLHLHTDYSLLDGACDVEKLVAHIDSIGQKAVAITDHGNIYGAVHWGEAISAKKSGCRFKGVPPPTTALSLSTTLSYLSSRLERSGGEGSAVRHSDAPPLPFCTTFSFVISGKPDAPYPDFLTHERTP